jgi:hypothetical protein
MPLASAAAVSHKLHKLACKQDPHSDLEVTCVWNVSGLMSLLIGSWQILTLTESTE